MATTGTQPKGTSLLEQTDEKKKGWSGLKNGVTIQDAVNNFDSNLAEYNTEGTTDARKSEINAMYGGDITKFGSGDDVYKAYNDDMQYINKIDSLNAGYQGTVKAAEQAEQKQLQYADTRRQLMQKYLPETLMAQGVANTGYTADALLKAENNYNQYVLGAMGEKAATEQNALKDYQQALGTYKAEQADKAYSEFLAKQEQAKTAEQESKDYQSALYNGAIELLGLGASLDEVMAYADGNNVDEATKAKIQSYYDAANAEDGSLNEGGSSASGSKGKLTADTNYNYTSQNFQVSTTKDKDKFKLQGANDVFRVSVGGKDYKAKTGDKVEASDYDPESGTAPKSEEGQLLKYANDHVAQGAVFLFKGKVYVKDTDGSVYPVNQKGWAKDAYNNIKDGLMNEFKSQYD